jgi:hypothetical protein
MLGERLRFRCAYIVHSARVGTGQDQTTMSQNRRGVREAGNNLERDGKSRKEREIMLWISRPCRGREALYMKERNR